MGTRVIKISEHFNTRGKFSGFRMYRHGHHFTLGQDRELAQRRAQVIEH